MDLNSKATKSRKATVTMSKWFCRLEDIYFYFPWYFPQTVPSVTITFTSYISIKHDPHPWVPSNKPLVRTYGSCLHLCSRFFQHVDEENSYLCGYLQINGLTDEYPKLTTFFDGEIISQKYPFLTRKWDADEDVDRKHWVSVCYYYRDY